MYFYFSATLSTQALDTSVYLWVKPLMKRKICTLYVHVNLTSAHNIYKSFLMSAIVPDLNFKK